MNQKASYLCDTAGNTVTVYVRGEIDHHTAVSIRNGIDGMLFEKRPQKLILDLSGVSFMDSSGLGLIMGRLSVMKSLGGDMILQNPGRETDVMLRLSGMERLLRIEHTQTVSGKAREAEKKPYLPTKAEKIRCIPQSESAGKSVAEKSKDANGSCRRKQRTTAVGSVATRKEEMA